MEKENESFNQDTGQGVLKEQEGSERKRVTGAILSLVESHADILTKEEVEDVRDIIETARRGTGAGPRGNPVEYNRVVFQGGLDYLVKVLEKTGKTPEESSKIIKDLLEEMNDPY